MAKDDNLIPVDDAMEILGCTEAQLQEMVQNKELRAFRHGGIKFRREDVLDMKAAKSTEPTIILPADAQAGVTQSGILDSVEDLEGTQPMMIDGLDILPDSEDVTQEMASPNVPVTDDYIPTVADDFDDKTMIDEGDDLMLDGEEFDDDEDEVFDDEEDQEYTSGRAMGVKRDAAVFAKKPGNPIMSTVLFLCTIIMLYGVIIALSFVYTGGSVSIRTHGPYGTTEIQRQFMPEYVKFAYELNPIEFLKKYEKNEFKNW